MREFSRLCQKLESVPFHRSKSAILATYLAQAPARDASWALFLLQGGQLPQILSPLALQEWILASSSLPTWLLEECREAAADWAETVALIGELERAPSALEAKRVVEDIPLHEWIELRLLPLTDASTTERQAAVHNWWKTLAVEISWPVHALALGRFPVRVSRRTAEDAVREAFGAEALPLLDDRMAELPLAGLRLQGVQQLDFFHSKKE